MPPLVRVDELGPRGPDDDDVTPGRADGERQGLTARSHSLQRKESARSKGVKSPKCW